MKRILMSLVLLVVVLVAATGCKSHPGSREFIPGQGWQKT